MTNKKTKLIVEIDPNELACLILEGSMGIGRPAGATACQALAYLDDETRAGLYKAAEMAAKYITDCIGVGRYPS